MIDILANLLYFYILDTIGTIIYEETQNEQNRKSWIYR